VPGWDIGNLATGQPWPVEKSVFQLLPDSAMPGWDIGNLATGQPCPVEKSIFQLSPDSAMPGWDMSSHRATLAG